MISIDMHLGDGTMRASARHHTPTERHGAFSVLSIVVGEEGSRLDFCLYVGDRPALANALVTAINKAVAGHGTTEPDAMKRLDTIAAPILGQVLGPAASPLPQAAE